MTAWTEDKVTDLRCCVADGLSSGLTAKKLGLTREAVISKAARLGLKWRNAAFNRGGATVNKTLKTIQDRARKPPVSPPPPDVRAREIPADPPRAIPPAPNSRPVDLMGLTNATCRWPLWEAHDDPRMFCGALEADNAAGIVYCDIHSRAAGNQS